MPFTIIRQDITQMDVDAIVNAANTALQMGGGVCGAIFQAAGAREMQAACDKLSPIRTGEAAVTPGFALRARHVIHAAGPVYRAEDAQRSEALLRATYLSALSAAERVGCRNIAFPLISSGIYGYPKAEALRVAVSAIRSYLDDHEMDVYLAVFDKAALDVGEKLMGAVQRFIGERYVGRRPQTRRELLEVEREALQDTDLMACDAQSFQAVKLNAAPCMPVTASLDEMIGGLDESFSKTLLRLIDAKGKTDVEVYKRANLDRKLFSKIRADKGYLPSKRTALALAVALELTRDETEALLKKAGFALSPSKVFDVVVEFFLLNRQYDVYEINEVLFRYDQPLLGG